MDQQTDEQHAIRKAYGKLNSEEVLFAWSHLSNVKILYNVYAYSTQI